MIKQGFLTRNKIITDYSRRIDCKSKIIEDFLNDKLIYRKNNSLLITDSHIKTLKLHAYKINLSNFNFIHNLNLINDLNELNLAPNLLVCKQIYSATKYKLKINQNIFSFSFFL